MCANCDSPMPEEAAKFMSMGLATVADEMQHQNDMQVRLACLNLAVKVKGGPDKDGNYGSSQKVLSSAHAYYDFVVGNDANIKESK